MKCLPPLLCFLFFSALLLFFQSMISLCWSHCPEIYLHFLHLKFRKLILRAGENLCSSKWIRFYKHTQNLWKAHLSLSLKMCFPHTFVFWKIPNTQKIKYLNSLSYLPIFTNKWLNVLYNMNVPAYTVFLPSLRH